MIHQALINSPKEIRGRLVPLTGSSTNDVRDASANHPDPTAVSRVLGNLEPPTTSCDEARHRHEVIRLAFHTLTQATVAFIRTL